MAGRPTTYSELCADIASWLTRDDQEDMIPKYIADAEARLTRTVFTPDREANATLVAAETISLPADFAGVRTAYLDTDPKVVLGPMPLGVLRGHYAAAYTGQPMNYAIVGANMILGPAPDSAYNVKLTYWKDLTPLSDTETSNWLLLTYPDLYKAAALVEAYLVLRDAEAATMWESRTSAKIEEVNRAGRRDQFAGPPQRIRSAVVV